MEQMKRFAFVIDAGDMLLVQPIWHGTEEEAKKHLQKTLAPCYSIVEDRQVIESYVNKELAEMEAEGQDTHKLTIGHYEDLQTIKKSLNKEEKEMNIEKIKEFIAMRKDLKDAGVIGLSVWDDEVQMGVGKMPILPNLVVTDSGIEKYPYQVSTVIDGIKLYAVYTEEEFAKYPQLQEYMVEDVILDGGDDHAA